MQDEESQILKRLGELLNITDLGGEDWDLVYADSQRIEEFCDIYEREALTEPEKIALMELLVASYDRHLNEIDLPDPALETRVGRLLEKDFNAHLHTIEYWSTLKSPSPECLRAVSPLMRRLLNANQNSLMETCIFCQIIKGVEPAHKIWESDEFLAFLSIHPVNPGHVCLIPKTHVDYVFDLEEPFYSRIFQAAKRLAGPIQQATSAKRIGIAVEGFSVPHVHVHLVPLLNQNELDPHRHIKQNQEQLAEMAAKIRNETCRL